MTIKQLLEITTEETEIIIGLEANVFSFDRSSKIAREALGRYAIGRITAMCENIIEVDIKMEPVTE